eukprot:m.233264 g.233264  ORF g.233264 m.233264 type:complete len:2757 (+) comp17378_c0_seq1:134-8404(+)
MARRESEEDMEGYLDVAADPDDGGDDLYEDLDNGFSGFGGIDGFGEPPAAEPARSLENPNYDTLSGAVPAGVDRSAVSVNPAYDEGPGAFDLMPNPAYSGGDGGDGDDAIYQDTFDLNDMEKGGAANPMMEDSTYFDPHGNAPTTNYFDPAALGDSEYGMPDDPPTKPIPMTNLGSDADDDIDVKPVAAAANTRKYKIIIAILIIIILGLIGALVAGAGASASSSDPDAAQSAADRNGDTTTTTQASGGGGVDPSTPFPTLAPTSVPTSGSSNCTQGCGANGVCNEALSSCDCSSGYFGPICNQTCPSKCTSPARGVCGGDGVCACVSGFEGDSCERSVGSFLGTFRNSESGALGDINQDNMKAKLTELEPSAQYSLGQCDFVTGALQCQIKVSTANGTAAPIIDQLMAAAANNSIELYNGGFQSVQKDENSPSYTLEAQCPFDCSGNGNCMPDGSCECFEKFQGVACSEEVVFLTCPGDCNGNGNCFKGLCECDEGYSGLDCTVLIKTCPSDCSNAGTCNTTTGVCACDDGFDGESCDVKLCAPVADCGLNGDCVDGVCECLPGYGGEACEDRPCSVDCGQHGECLNDACVCDMGWSGAFCDSYTCPDECNAPTNGACVQNSTTSNYYCSCNTGYQGLSCAGQIETQCTDGLDNDGDRAADCDDADCCSHSSCADAPGCRTADRAVDKLVKFDQGRALDDVDEEEDVSFYQQMMVLLEGENATQMDHSMEAFSNESIALVSGLILDQQQVPLPGVIVAVMNRSEFGYTITASDGTFDLVVNGDGLVTLSVARPAYMTGRRTPFVAPLTLNQLANPIIIQPVSTVSTQVDLSRPGTAITEAVGETVTDTSGSRTTRTFVPPTLAASVRNNEDGSETPLSSMTIRQTEFTQGPNGQEAMPSELPDNSGYTYALEMSIDEASTNGSTDVVFSDPIPFYVDNFLNFPTGSAVPVGSFDRNAASWMPETDGRVIRIKEVITVDGVQQVVLELRANLTALVGTVPSPVVVTELDTNCNDLDDNDDESLALQDVTATMTDAELEASLGITLAEKQQLAKTYEAGKELWRVQMGHFTPYDCNWPYGPAPGSCSASECPEAPDDPNDDDDQDDDPDCEEQGSIIKPATQTLAESIDIPGSSLSLYYSSNRMPGYHIAIEVPATPGIIPEPLRSVVVTLRIAGVTMTRTLSSPLQPRDTVRFLWDRRDYRGALVLKETTYKVERKYVYPLVYYPTRSGFAASFGRVSSRVSVPGGRFRDSDITRREDRTIEVYDDFEGQVQGRRDIRRLKMGGWSISQHHAYNKVTGTLHRGDGSRRSFYLSKGVTQTVLGGNGRRSATCFDCVTSGDTSRMYGPVALTHHPSGSLFIGDYNVIYRREPNGTVTEAYRFPSGQEPTQAYFMTVHPVWGDLIISIPNRLRVYRLTSAGELEVIIGNGERCDPLTTSDDAPECGEGGLAVDASLMLPQGIVALKDGDMYLADGTRILQVTPDKRIATHIGRIRFKKDLLPAYEGGPISQSILARPTSLAYNSVEDSLYFIDAGHSLIYRITTDSQCDVVAGYPPNALRPPQPQHTQDERIGITETIADLTPLDTPTGLAVTLTGTVVFIEQNLNRIREVTSTGRLKTLAGASRSQAACSVSSTASCPGMDKPQSPDEATFKAPADISLFGTQVFVADEGNRAIRMLGVKDTFERAQEILVPEIGTALVYVFDQSGRHLHTRSTITNQAVVTFTYDSTDPNLLMGMTSVYGENIQFVRDPITRRLTSINANGDITQVTIDADGFLRSVRSPFGTSVEFTYKPGPNGVSTGLLASQADVLGHIHRYEYNAAGRLTADSGPRGERTQLLRRETRNKVEIIVTLPENDRKIIGFSALSDADGSQTDYQNSYGGTAVTKNFADGSWTSTKPDGSVLTTKVGPHPVWEGQARVVTETVLTMPNQGSIRKNYKYTATLANSLDPFSITSFAKEERLNDRVVVTSTRNIMARTLTVDVPGVGQTVVSYDNFGRMLERSYPGTDLVSLVNTYGEQGKVNHTKRGDITADYEYDSDGRIIRYTTSGGIDIQYNDSRVVNGTRSEVILPSGRTYAFVKDVAGRMRKVIVPGGKTFSLAYADTLDDAGDTYVDPEMKEVLEKVGLDRRVESIHFASGAKITHSFDFSRRVVLRQDGDQQLFVSYVAGTDKPERMNRVGTNHAAVSMQFSYDGALQKGFSTDLGLMRHEVRFSYDSMWRPSSMSLLINDNTMYTRSVGRNSNGIITSDDGLTVTYSSNRRTVTARVSNSYGWSSTDDVVGLTVKRELFSKSGAATFTDNLVRKEGHELLTGWINTLPGGVELNTTFEYDVDGQLSKVYKNGVVTESYQYDLNGNRVNWTVDGTSHTAKYLSNDAVYQVDGLDYVSDDDGFLTTARGMTLTYARRGELLRAVTPTEDIRYRYDGLGRRVTREKAGREEVYIYGDLSNVQRITDVYRSGVLHSYLYDSAGRLTGVRYRASYWSTPVYYLVISDYVGTPRMVIDTRDQSVVLERTYDAFGRMLTETGTFKLAIGFAGGLLDEDTGLVNFYHRDYDTYTGRFTAKDPLVFGGGSPNLFAYVFNDPVNFRDPLGLFCFGMNAGFGLGTGFSACFDPFKWEASVCVRKYVGFGGGFTFDPTGEARASSMRAYAKAYGTIEAGPVSIEGEVSGTYDFTPETMPGRNPCNDGFNAQAGVKAQAGNHAAKYDALENKGSYEYENQFGLDSLERDIGGNTGKSAFGKPVSAKAGVEAGVQVCAGNGKGGM